MKLVDQTATAPGIRVFSGFTGTQLTASPINLGLRPNDMAIARFPPLDVAGGTPGDRTKLSWAAPNPSRSGTRIQLTLPEAERVDVTVFDLAGRRVRSLGERAARASGRLVVPWDARDDRGRRVAPGVYVYRATGESVRQSGTVTIVR